MAHDVTQLKLPEETLQPRRTAEAEEALEEGRAADAGASESAGRRLASILIFPITLGGTLWAAIEAIGHGYDAALVVAAIIPVAVLVVSVAERLLPHRPEWNRPRGDVVTDVWHIIVGGLTAPEFYRFLLALMLVPVAAWIASNFGVPIWPSHWPLLGQLALAAVIAEFGQYWAHRFAHETWLWWTACSRHSHVSCAKRCAQY